MAADSASSSAWVLTEDMITKYFARIRYIGGREPTLDTLRGIALAHVTAVPFENIDMLLDNHYRAFPRDSFAKIVERGRGGYCFEQNGLLVTVLQALGFKAIMSLSRPLWMRPRGMYPRTHGIIIVTFEGGDKPPETADPNSQAADPKSEQHNRREPQQCQYLVDVGFGACSVTGVLKIVPDVEQQTLHEPHRFLLHERAGWMYHQVLLGGEWRDMYEFDQCESFPCDWDLHHWYTSRNPDAMLKGRLIVSLPTRDGGRYTIHNREYKIKRRETLDKARQEEAGQEEEQEEGEKEKEKDEEEKGGKSPVAAVVGGGVTVRELAHMSDLLTVLKDIFGISLPADTSFNVRLFA